MKLKKYMQHKKIILYSILVIIAFIMGAIMIVLAIVTDDKIESLENQIVALAYFMASGFFAVVVNNNFNDEIHMLESKMVAQIIEFMKIQRDVNRDRAKDIIKIMKHIEGRKGNKLN